MPADSWPPTQEQFSDWVCGYNEATLREFLRDPRLREALDLAEAVKWIEENEAHVSHRTPEETWRPKPWAAFAYTMDDPAVAFGDTLPAAVSALKDRLTPKEESGE
jgi:hypothetical protein